MQPAHSHRHRSWQANSISKVENESIILSPLSLTDVGLISADRKRERERDKASRNCREQLSANTHKLESLNVTVMTIGNSSSLTITSKISDTWQDERERGTIWLAAIERA